MQKKALDDVKKRLEAVLQTVITIGEQAVYRADDYVHENPGKELVWARPLGWY